MLLSWAQAFKLLLALFTDGKIEDCMQRGAQRADEVSATLSLPLVLLVLAGKARKILREIKHECFQNILMPYLNTNSIIRTHKYPLRVYLCQVPFDVHETFPALLKLTFFCRSQTTNT